MQVYNGVHKFGYRYASKPQQTEAQVPMVRPTTGNGSPSRNSNRLIRETSPYLQQHAWNPVDWYPWGEEALGRARREDRMIFLSIGYSSCHWCHVMERESFEDPEVARLLNEHFVNIKVDREERPDVDAVYMEALQMMTGQGGWPLNVWLTPDQIPIYAGTYFPPRDLYGRPGFSSIIRKLIDIYTNQPDKVKQQSAEVRQALQNDIYDQLLPGEIDSELLTKAYSGYVKSYDATYGGFSGAPKFPAAMGTGFLLRYGLRPGSQQAHQMAFHTLEKMIGGGIYDQVGGGFHRYSTDEEWLVPHFEKMLYDNALLLSAMAEAFVLSGRTLFSEVAGETVTFLNREMRHPDGGYYSALDADTDGVEGAFYVFTDDEFRRILDQDSIELATDFFGVKPEGNWEGVSVLHRARSVNSLCEKYGTDEADLNNRLSGIKKQLLKYRNTRTRPGLDTKVITSWNALLLIALCRCVRLLDHAPDDAVRLGTFLAGKVLKDNKVYRITDQSGNVSQPGFLDDYALLAEGFSRLFEITGDEKWLSIAAGLCQTLLEQFYDRNKNAFRYKTRDQPALIASPRDLFDNVQPSGTSAAITALFRTGHLCGMPEWTRTSVKAMEPLSGIAANHPTAFGYLLQNMHHHLFPGNEIVITSENPGSDPVAQKMMAIWREYYDSSSYLITRTTGPDSQKAPNMQQKPLSSPVQDSEQSDLLSEYVSKKPEFLKTETGYMKLYKGKTAIDDKTTAWICKNFSCRQPVFDPDIFRKVLAESDKLHTT